MTVPVVESATNTLKKRDPSLLSRSHPALAASSCAHTRPRAPHPAQLALAEAPGRGGDEAPAAPLVWITAGHLDPTTQQFRQKL